MYRIVASDMDETFLARDAAVPQANIDAIRRMRELGCLFVPASGRPYPSILHSIAAVPDELMEGSYVISYNGGCINRFGCDEPVRACPMDADKVRAIFDYARRLDVGLHVYELSGKVWVSRIDAAERAYIANRMETFDLPGDDFSALEGRQLAKILYVKAGGMSYLHDVADHMPASLLDGVDMTYSSSRYLEFVPRGVSKGSGLKELADLLGIDMSETIACGDAANDESMVTAAGVGVAVANAGDGLPEKADYVAAATCDDGVLAEVVERFVEPSHGHLAARN